MSTVSDPTESTPSPTLSDILSTRPDLVVQLKAATPPLPPLAKDLIPQLRILADDAENAKQIAAHTRNELAAARAEIETLRTKLRRASSTISTLSASELNLQRKSDYNTHLASCTPTIIGGRSGLHPSTLDIHIEELPQPSHSDLACPPQIAWVPVLIWPFGIPGKPFTTSRGTITPVDIGTTNIRESLATIRINIPTTRSTPNGDITTYTAEDYTLTGFCRLSLNPVDPATLQKNLDRRESRENWYANTDPSTPDADQDAPPFIPSRA